MGLNEREKIIALTSRVRAMVETNIGITGTSDKMAVVAAGEQLMNEMFTELGLNPQTVILEDIAKFEDELDVISAILNKEDGI